MERGINVLYKLPVDDFLSQLGSKSPAPGGGSVAALAGALSGSLVAMVGRLSGKNGEDQQRLTEIVSQADRLRSELRDLIEQDTQAFNMVMEAFKLPKTTDEEKQLRRQQIQAGMKQAAYVPLQVMETSLAVLGLAKEIAIIGNQNAITDAGVAGLMGYAAVQGASYNVRINLLSIKDQDFVKETEKRLVDVSSRATDISQEISTLVEKNLKK